MSEARFIGELVTVSTKTNKKGQTETTITFKVDNGRYGKLPQAVYDCQGLPCLVEIAKKEEDDEEAKENGVE